MSRKASSFASETAGKPSCTRLFSPLRRTSCDKEKPCGHPQGFRFGEPGTGYLIWPRRPAAMAAMFRMSLTVELVEQI